MCGVARWLRVAGLLVVLAVLPRPVQAHGAVMRLGSSHERAGQLIVVPDFDFGQSVTLTASIVVGGFVFYTDLIPSFAWVIEPEPAANPVVYPLRARTQVSFELVSITEGAAVRINGVRLASPGRTAPIGEVSFDPEAHVHPEWQFTLPEGKVGDFEISFRLTTTARDYTASAVYRLTLTNRAPPPTASFTETASPTLTASPTQPPTSTAEPTVRVTESPSSTPTSSPLPTATAASVCAGDCDRDGRVIVSELVTAVNIALGNADAAACQAADTDQDTRVTVDEIVRALMHALVGCGNGRTEVTQANRRVLRCSNSDTGDL